MHNFETPSSPERADTELTPKEVLDYIAKLGEDIAEIARNTKLMLDIAEEGGAEVDLSNNESLKDFQPTGSAEQALTELRLKVGLIQSEFANQGVNITHEELAKRKAFYDSLL